MLIALILCIAVGNLALGYMLSIRFRRLCATDPYLAADWDHLPHARPLTSAASLGHGEGTAWTASPGAPANSLPSAWLNTWEEDSGAKNAAASGNPLLRFHVGEYREQLVALDARLRATQLKPAAHAIRKIVHDLTLANQAWFAQLEGHPSLEASFSEQNESAIALAELQRVFWEQMAQLETTNSNLRSLDLDLDPAEAARQLLPELNRLLDLCHRLRDAQQAAFAAAMREGQQLGQLPRELLIDELTGLNNLSGLQKYLDSYRSSDPHGQREACLGWISVDHLAAINKQVGPRAGDRLLTAVGRIISCTLRVDRGADLGCRVSGAGFAAFLGDTGPRSATAAVERIRQTVAESYFEWNDGPLDVTISCGVTRVLPGETLFQMVRKARDVALHAQLSGGNCTWLSDGAGPQAIQAPIMKTRPGNFILNDEAASQPG